MDQPKKCGIMPIATRAITAKRREPGKNPGPAFYKPLAEPKKTSFHLNTENKWIV
jgi:hypothetical protein